MKRSTGRIGLLVFIAVTLTALSFGVVVAHNGTLVVDNAVETENQTVTHNGTEYTVSTLGWVKNGESLTVRATSPTNVNYVHLYDSDGAIVIDRHVEVNESVEIETGNIEPGEYLVATHDKSGTFHAVQPVVVTSYNTSLSTATTPTEDGQRRFSVNVTETSDAPEIERVEVVIHDNGTFTRIPASKTGEGAYTATADLEPGEYQAYAVVHGGDEIVGLSDTNAVTITEQANQSTQTATAQPTQSTQTATTTSPVDASNETGSDTPTARLVESLPTELLDSKWVSLVNGPVLVVGGVFGTLVLSTAVYQVVYSLRRR